jgi:hypothetical protein
MSDKIKLPITDEALEEISYILIIPHEGQWTATVRPTGPWGEVAKHNVGPHHTLKALTDVLFEEGAKEQFDEFEDVL